MELSHAIEIYKEKYEKDMTMETYMDYLNKGFELLKDNAAENALELKDLKAIRIALEYRRQIITLNLKNKDSLINSYIRSLS
jgi:hypothetical protein